MKTKLKEKRNKNEDKIEMDLKYTKIKKKLKSQKN